MNSHVFPLLLASGFLSMQGAAQSCVTSGLSGSNACIQPGDSSGNPTMPTMAFDYDPCTVADAHITVQYTNAAAAPFNQTAGQYSSGDTSGGGEWLVDWTNNAMDPDQFYEGGNAVYLRTPLSNGQTESFPFAISGINPSLGSLTGFLQGNNAPWWYGHALTQESSNRQFYSPSGTPIFGGPDGFGVAQIDGKGNPGFLRDDDLWAWSENLIDGLYLAHSKQQPAYTYIGQQFQNMIADTKGFPVVPPPMTFAGCPTMTLTGQGASGFGDAEWITSYNGGHFATWNRTTLAWNIRTGYISAVCAIPSLTI